MDAQIRYTHTPDGVAIAYAIVGEGPPLLFARPFLFPGLDDEIALPSRVWPGLTRSHSVVLWDSRGSGLSGTAPITGFDDWLADIDAVADAAGAGSFDLVGLSVPCHAAAAYAARHGDRVKRLVLYAPMYPGFSQRRVHPEWLFRLAHEDYHDFVDILALRMFGWSRADAAERWADRIGAHFTSQQFLRLMDLLETLDATPEAGRITAPTLVINEYEGGLALTRQEPSNQPFAALNQRFARELAAKISGAQLAVIRPGDGNPAQVVEQFLSGGSTAAVTLREASTPSDTAIILFADVVESTAITARIGNEAFRERTLQLDDALRAVIRDEGGSPVEGRTLGDGVLGVFTSAAQAIAAALQSEQHAERVGLQLHLGIHAGDVMRESGGGVSGLAVSMASRISDLTGPNEILVSGTVRDLARASTGVTFEDRGEHVLKGIADAVRVYAVRQGSG